MQSLSRSLINAKSAKAHANDAKNTQASLAVSRLSHVFRSFASPHGFTLIELLVVVAIIGILTTMVTVSSTAARAQARDAQRKADLQTVASTLEVYRATNKKYPDIQSRAGSWTALKTVLYPTYTTQWPEDPKNGGAYVYQYVSNAPTLAVPGSMYALDAVLENDAEKITAPEADESSNATLNAFVTGTFKSQLGASANKIKQRVSGR